MCIRDSCLCLASFSRRHLTTRFIERYAYGVRVRDDAARDDDDSRDAFERAFERAVRASGDDARVVRG